MPFWSYSSCFSAKTSLLFPVCYSAAVDWSLRYFSVPPAVIGLFFTDPILPGLGLLFAGLFCLQRYLQERSGAWLFLTALLFAALIEVKIFTAAQIMCSLGVAAVPLSCLHIGIQTCQSRCVHRRLTAPLGLAQFFFRNKSEANFVMKFKPGL